MSASPVDDLLGLRLTSHEIIEDYEQLTFEDGAAILSVYNPYELRGPEPESGKTITSVMGRCLLAVTTRPSLVELRFEDGWSVTVDTRDEAFTGPEAMTLDQPGKPTVVWT